MKIDSTGTLSSVNYVDKFKTKQNEELMKIAAAKAVSSTDGASMQIYDDLQSQVNEYTQGIKNANDAIGYLQIANGAMQSLTDGSQKLNELSVQYNSAALSSDGKNAIMAEAEKLKESMKQSVQSASFNGKNTLNGDASFYIGGGNSQSVSLTSPNIDKIDVTKQDSILNFQKEVSAVKSSIGSSINGITSSIDSNMAAITSMSAAKSQIGDTDFAQAISNFNNSGAQLNFATMALAHGNSLNASRVEGLLR